MRVGVSMMQRYKIWGFLLLVMVLAVGLIILPRTVAFVVLGLLLILGLSLGAYRAGHTGALRFRSFVNRLSVGQQRRIARLLWSIAVVVALMAAVNFRPEAPDNQVDVGLRLWLLTGVLVTLAIQFWPGTLPAYFQRHDVSPYVVVGSKVRWWLVGLSILTLVVLTEANAHLFGTTLALNVHMQFGLLVTGCIILALGLGARRSALRTAAKSRRVMWVLVGLTLLAFALNTVGIEDYVHMWIDEFHFTDMILRMWDDPAYPLVALNHSIAAFTSLFAYLQMVSVSIFGTELIALRMVSAFFGAATIPAVYLLGRELFDRKTALLAALMLVMFPPQIHFSRLGINNIADPLFGVLALAFLVRGLKYGRRGDYALAGIMLGLTQYFYEGGKLLYPALLLGWIVCLSLLWRPRIHWRGLVVMLFTALLVALPVYITIDAMNSPLTPRLQYYGVLDQYWTPLTEGGLGHFLNFQYRSPLLMFVHLPDMSGLFYGGDTAIILNYLVPFFVIGVVIAVLRLRVTGLLLLLWLAGTIIGNSLIGQWVYTARYVVTFPAVALLLAVGIRYVLIFLSPWQTDTLMSGRWRDGALLVAGAVICVILTVPQVFYYFGPHLALYNQQTRPYYDHVDMMYRTRNFPSDVRIFAVKTPENEIFADHFRVLEAFWGLEARIQIFEAGAQTSQIIANLTRETDIALFVEPDDYETLYAIYEHYGSISPQYSPYNVPLDRQYLLFYLIAPDHTVYHMDRTLTESRAG